METAAAGPLIAIADLAGGQWPGLIRTAAENAAVAPGRPSELERLLASIRLAFELQAEKDKERRKAGDKTDDNHWPDNQHRLCTNTLLTALLAEQAEEWNTAHRGRPISAYWLRDRLRHLLNPPGAQEWLTGPYGNRLHHSGDLKSQFARVWETHLAGDAPSPSTSLSASGSSGSVHENEGETAGNPPVYNEPDAEPDAAPV